MKDSTFRGKLITIYSILLLYLILFILLGQLRFEIRKDEAHYWPTSLRFSRDWIPSADLLKSYDELSTPLSFAVFGTFEHLFHGGIFAGRLVNFLLSFGILTILVFFSDGRSRNHLFSVIGVLIYPYFIACSTHLYPDIIATFLVLLGVIAYMKGLNWISCLSFVLAIAARQYMLAFPLGIFIFETLNLLKSKKLEVRRRIWVRSLCQGIACLSIAGWIFLWGNFGPSLEVIKQNVRTISLFNLIPEHSLYFLSCLGFYFVIPEFILLRRTTFVKNFFNGIAVAILVCISLFVLFLLFPPYQNVNYDIPTMGYMDKLFRMVAGDLVRMAMFYVLALIACLRFLTIDLESFVVLANGLLMLKSHIAWDKYLLPLIVVLWLFNSIRSPTIPHLFEKIERIQKKCY